MQKDKVGKLDMDMVTELNGMVIQEVEGGLRPMQSCCSEWS